MRYSRQIVLRGIGIEGQRRLKKARVCIAGVGGLGSISAPQLAAMGVGYLRLVDHDIVELANLQRQTLYETQFLGYPKVEVAAKRLKAINPSIEVEPMPITINATSADRIVEGMDVVIDGLDRVAPRYAINRACLKLKVPYVFAAAIETYGNVSTILPEKTACLECFFGRLSDEGLPTCETVGVFPPILGVIASVEVRESVNLILGRESFLANKILFCNLDYMSFETFQVVRSSTCLACGKSLEPLTFEEPRVAELCGGNSIMVSPREALSLNLEASAKLLKYRFPVRVQGQLGLTFDYSEDISVSLMRSGSMLIKGIGNREKALRIYDSLMELIQESIDTSRKR
ncbi:MAG: HesA/MoeB/ThiF family protein [Candidatus Bathyarchaeia archaeon]